MSITTNDHGRIVNFSVYPSAILGSDFTNAKVLCVIDADTASAFMDVQAMHANVAATLPAGFNHPGAYNTYNYVRLQLAGGQRVVIGLPWIIESTIEWQENLKYVIEVNNVNAGDLPMLRNALLANGFNDITITAVSL